MGAFATYNDSPIGEPPRREASPLPPARPMLETRIIRCWILGPRNPYTGVPYLPTLRIRKTSHELRRIEKLLNITFIPLPPPGNLIAILPCKPS